MKIPEHMNVEEALSVFAGDPSVEYAEPNYIVRTAATRPDDLVSNLWGLDNVGQNVNGTSGTNDKDIDAPEAWHLCTGSDRVIVAVIDSGVDYNHPDLAANIWKNSGESLNGIDDDGNGYVDDVRGWDWVDGDNDPIDYNDHGTHCAGIIAAAGNNGTGISGLCWSAKIMPLRFTNKLGYGNIADAISAINYADSMGAHILNNSRGTTKPSTALREAINATPALAVCAAGNEGANSDTSPYYPASYTCANIIAVAATDQNDALAFFSNYGASSVDVGAPGVNIYSASPARQTVWEDDFERPSALGKRAAQGVPLACHFGTLTAIPIPWPTALPGIMQTMPTITRRHMPAAVFPLMWVQNLSSNFWEVLKNTLTTSMS